MTQQLSTQDVQAEVLVMLWSAELTTIRRYHNMTYWEEEALEESSAEASRSGPRLESVADHSWHLADCVLLLHPHFPDLDLCRCLSMSILHDKLEITIGDAAPMGRSGTGYDGTAYNKLLLVEKEAAERAALEKYLERVPDVVAKTQRLIFEEYAAKMTEEARFVYAIDKLQVYTWLIRKKRGIMTDAHLAFSLPYLRTRTLCFPGLEPYVREFENRLLDTVARARNLRRDIIDELVKLKSLRATSPEIRHGMEHPE